MADADLSNVRSGRGEDRLMPGTTAGWDAIRARVAEIGNSEVHVGIVGAGATAEHGATGATNGEIALWQEYGTDILPERSFLRRTLRDPERLAELRTLQERFVRAVLAGTLTEAQALGLLGAWAASAIQSTIVDDKVSPALKQSTIDRKGSAKVLVDTGQLARSVSWVVIA